jgi:DNA-binding beta-propeller fold protein YncE
MQIGTGSNTYEWIDGWAQYPDTEASRTGWVHPGMIVNGAGEVVTTHTCEPTVLFYDSDGNLLRSWNAGGTEVHDIVLVKEGDTEYLWLVDNGSKRQPEIGYDYPTDSPTTSGRVSKTTMDGQTVMTLTLPDLPDYQGSRCAVTEVAVNEERHGGNGDIWVADGYGENYVHRYDKTGRYLSSINGEEGAGKFNCPHGVFIDTRKAEPALYVADRASGRVQVFDTEGQFKRVFGEDFLTLPSTMVSHGDQLIIGQLSAKLTVVDAEDNLVCHLGANDAVCDVDGWPNNRDSTGRVVPTTLLELGKFNSPHGLTVDSEGNLYIAEWLIGGRMTKLVKV